MTDAELAEARLTALLDAERENTALRAKVEYLQGERADAVAWLREQRAYGTDELLGQGFAVVCGILADTIERGEHRREEER